MKELLHLPIVLEDKKKAANIRKNFYFSSETLYLEIQFSTNVTTSKTLINQMLDHLEKDFEKVIKKHLKLLLDAKKGELKKITPSVGGRKDRIDISYKSNRSFSVSIDISTDNFADAEKQIEDAELHKNYF